MRITFILPVASLGGGTRVVAIHAQNLARLGHDVRVISLPSPAVSARRKVKSLLTVGKWPSTVRPQSHLDGRGIAHHVLERWRPVTDDDVPDGDVVVATWWETAEWVNALSPAKGAKVYFIQGHEIFSHLPVDRCHATYRLPLHKIVVARWLRDVMSTWYGDNDVHLVPNSVDQSQFSAAIRDKQPVPTVGCLYSTHAFKGLDVSLAAFRAVRERLPDLRLISFGVGMPPPGFPEGTELFASPAQDLIPKLYASCDVWITASRSEGFNLPAMEAMACRTPVVATCTGWPEEAVVTGKNGVLVDIDDMSGFARGVEWVLSRSNVDWRELSANAYATASVGSWQESVRMFEAALEYARRKSVSQGSEPAPNGGLKSAQREAS